MVLNGTDTREAGKHWACMHRGLRLGDQLVSVNGQPISNAEDLEHILSSLQVGQTVSVVMRTPRGWSPHGGCHVTAFPVADRISYFVIPVFLSLVFLVISLWIFGLRRTESAGRAFSMMTTSLAIVIGALFDLYTSHRFTYFWTMAALFPAAP